MTDIRLTDGVINTLQKGGTGRDSEQRWEISFKLEERKEEVQAIYNISESFLEIAIK